MKSTLVIFACVLLAHEAYSCKKLLKEPLVLCLQAPAPTPCAAAPLLAPTPALPAVTPASLDMSCLLNALASALPSALATCASCNQPPQYHYGPQALPSGCACRY